MGHERGDVERALKLAAAFAILATSLVGVLDHDLWTPDEPRVAAVGRAVLEGDRVVPTLNGEPFLEEPPLHAWCVALFYGAFGVERPHLARWVSVAAGLGSCAAAYLLGSRLLGKRGGVLCALCLTLTAEHLNTSHRVVVDGLLAALTAASTVALVSALQGPAGPRRSLLCGAGYLFASAAFLTKGPIGLAVPALAVVALALVQRAPRVFLHAEPWLAPLAFALVAGPWLWQLHRQMGWEGLRVLLGDNLLGRVLPAEEGSRSHLRAWWFYLLHVPVGLLPVTPLVVLGALDRRRRQARLLPAEKSAYDFAFTWLGLGVLLLSAASTKRPVYAVPLYPAAALAAATWLDAWIEGREGGLFAGEEDQGRRIRVIAQVSIVVVVLAAVAATVAFPWIDQYKSYREVCRRVAELVPSDQPISSLLADETTRGMIPLYTGRPLRRLADSSELLRNLEARGEVYLLTVEKKGKDSMKLAGVDDLPSELLLEEIREGTRSFRLYRVLKAR